MKFTTDVCISSRPVNSFPYDDNEKYSLSMQYGCYSQCAIVIIMNIHNGHILLITSECIRNTNAGYRLNSDLGCEQTLHC